MAYKLKKGRVCFDLHRQIYVKVDCYLNSQEVIIRSFDGRYLVQDEKSLLPRNYLFSNVYKYLQFCKKNWLKVWLAIPVLYLVLRFSFSNEQIFNILGL